MLLRIPVAAPLRSRSWKSAGMEQVLRLSTQSNSIQVSISLNSLYQDPLAKSQLQGSAVLVGESGATFTVVALVMAQGASGPLFTMIPVAEGTGIANPIVPGVWHASTAGMSLDFTVNSSADRITELTYTFSGLTCGGVTLTSGSVTVIPGVPWPISNRQFLITRLRRSQDRCSLARSGTMARPCLVPGAGSPAQARGRDRVEDGAVSPNPKIHR